MTDRIHGPQAPFPTPYGEVEPLPFCRDVDPAAISDPGGASADPAGASAWSEQSGSAAASETEDVTESLAKRARRA